MKRRIKNNNDPIAKAIHFCRKEEDMANFQLKFISDYIDSSTTDHCADTSSADEQGSSKQSSSEREFEQDLHFAAREKQRPTSAISGNNTNKKGQKYIQLAKEEEVEVRTYFNKYILGEEVKKLPGRNEVEIFRIAM